MNAFTGLFNELDQTTSTSKKVEILVNYFSDPHLSETDKLWTIALFSHRRPPRAVSTTKIREWSAEIANLPLWLFEETYHIVGDLAETIALLVPSGTLHSSPSLTERIEQLIHLKSISGDGEQKQLLTRYWSEMNKEELFLFNKLLTGGFRVGISQNIITKALARCLDRPENEIAHDLMGDWHPHTTTWNELFHSKNEEKSDSKPYPFFLAYPLEKELEELGAPHDWAAEYKWDGIRGQIIIRKGKVYIWSRGEELITEKFPELTIFTSHLQNIVMDGEIVIMQEGKTGSFQQLQTRIGRKNVSKKMMMDHPAHFIAYDLLEYEGKDVRSRPYVERRALLNAVISILEPTKKISLSPYHEAESWQKFTDLRQDSSNIGAEGLMLKRKESPYQSGRKKGDWYKWKVDPYTVDAVMIYAQRGHGRRANLFTDFTFAVLDEQNHLVPFTKAYSGLKDEEFREVTAWVKNNTVERFGPVCSVKPELVFELAFEGIAWSKRHKSGVALRFPRIKAWRKDKIPGEIDSLETLKALITG